MTVEEFQDASSRALVTRIQGPVGGVVTAHHIDGGIHNHLYGKFALTAALDDDSVSHLRSVFVRPRGWDEALATLRARQVVVLVGEPGGGRRIAAVNLLSELGLPVRELLLPEGDDLDGQFLVEPGTGYLLVAPRSETAGVVGHVSSYLGEVVSAGSFMVIAATEPMARQLELVRRTFTVRLQAADSTAVFQRTVATLRGEADADAWSQNPRLVACLAGAAPEDACRLGTLLAGVLEEQHGKDPVAETLAAYGDWAEDLKQWDREVAGRDDAAGRRAMLLSVAAFETSSPSVVLGAAEYLMSIAEPSLAERSGLRGPGLSEQLDQAKAVVDRRGQVTFNRTDFARAVLDRTWNDRPHLRRTLVRWLTNAHHRVRGCDGDHAGDVLLDIAERQGAADEILSLAAIWAKRGRGPQAARILTRAALSLSLGRAVRRRLYEWATHQGVDVQVHLLVADVCSGDLADSYPGISLTRLRHLANRDALEVQDAVVRAVSLLASTRRVGFQLERSVRDWMVSGDGVRAFTGRRAFLSLARLRGDEGDLLVMARAFGQDSVSLLADCWREVLRDPVTRAETSSAVSDWLEAAAFGEAPSGLVVQVFTGACRSSVDAALLNSVIEEWLRHDEGRGTPERATLARELYGAISRNDGLTRTPTSPSFLPSPGEGAQGHDPA